MRVSGKLNLMINAPIWILDAFVGTLASRALRGNPAAVVLLDEFAPDAQLQERANEFGLSETAFLVSCGPQNFDLRWFTPQIEVDLCGHATLAATAALVDAKKLLVGQIARFHTRSGVLKALVEPERTELDFPVQLVEAREMPDELAQAFGWDKTERHFEKLFSCFRAADDWLVLVHEAILQNVRPDFAALAQIDARGVILTAQPEWKTEEADFYSRFFAPRVGVDEDPVTGSAHTKLAPFWSSRLGKTKMNAVQLSPRGGRLQLHVRGNRVGIAGQCHLRARGELC